MAEIRGIGGVGQLWASILGFPGGWVMNSVGIETEFVGSRGASGLDCTGNMCCIDFLGKN